MKYAEFFVGIGGFSLGLDAAGHKRVFTCEIDKYCGRVYGERFGKAFDEKDINRVRAARIPDCDLWVGGFPCQDLSVAGKRGGIKANRSGLVWKLLRLARVRRPRWIALENVPGLLSSQEGADTELLLAEMAKLWPSVGWRVLDAQFFGVPQRRRRIFLVGGPGADAVASVLFEPACGPGDPQPCGAEGEGDSREVARCVGGVSGGQDPAAGKGTVIPVASSVTARQGKGAFTAPDQDGVICLRDERGRDSEGRTITDQTHPLHCAKGPSEQQIIAFNPQAGGSQDRLNPNTQGVDALVGSQTPAIAIAHTLAGEGHDASEDGTGRGTPLVVSHTLTKTADKSGGHGRGTPIIPVGYNVVGMAQQGKNHAVETNKSGTLQHKGANPTGNEAGTIIFTEQSTNQEASPTLVSGGKRGRNSINHPCVSIAPTLSTKNEPANSRAGRDKWREQCAETGMAVRRLTPTECERLQGFPDGHTCLCGVRPDCPDRRIPPWVNRSKITLGGCGHSACGCKCPDSPRYRALGNAVAVPVIRWLGSRFP